MKRRCCSVLLRPWEQFEKILERNYAIDARQFFNDALAAFFPLAQVFHARNQTRSA